MDIQVFQTHKELFESLGAKALTLSHYDLALETGYGTPQSWKAFLTEPEIADWIKSELAMLQDAELRKLLHDISKSHSVGQAQLINALAKLTDENKNTKEGPVFIYTYIPLSKEQEKAPNVIKLDIDPFIK